MNEPHPSLERDTITEAQPITKPPSLYRVVLLNDDYTPMDFVTWLLKTVFYKPEEEALRLMLKVHQEGKGVCGIYPYDVAQTKVQQVKSLTLEHEYPLECITEEEKT